MKQTIALPPKRYLSAQVLTARPQSEFSIYSRLYRTRLIPERPTSGQLWPRKVQP